MIVLHDFVLIFLDPFAIVPQEFSGCVVVRCHNLSLSVVLKPKMKKRLFCIKRICLTFIWIMYIAGRKVVGDLSFLIFCYHHPLWLARLLIVYSMCILTFSCAICDCWNKSLHGEMFRPFVIPCRSNSLNVQ